VAAGAYILRHRRFAGPTQSASSLIVSELQRIVGQLHLKHGSDDMKVETMEEYIARGGKIEQCKPGPEKYDHSAKYRKDKQLNALRLLKKQIADPKDLQKVEDAIMTRIQILKVTF
jgi:hypothetical protein